MARFLPPSVLHRALRDHRRAIVGSSVLLATHQLAEAAVPVLVGVVIDRAVGTGDVTALVGWLAALAGLFVLLSTSWRTGYWVNHRAELRAAHEVRTRVARRVLDPAGGTEPVGTSGELVSLASTDADRTALVCPAVGFAVAALTVLVGGAVVLLSTSVQLGLVVLVGVPLVLVASRLLARPLVGRAEAEQESLARATSVAADLVIGLRVLKGIGAERAATARYRTASRCTLRARLAAARLRGGYEAATQAVSGAFLVVVAWVGGRLALDGVISIGQLVASVGLAQFLVGPLDRLTASSAVLAQARASAGRVTRLLATPPGVRAGFRPLPGQTRGALRLSGVTAGTLRSVDLDVAAGEHVGVVAPDPRDAAALLDILARRVDPQGVVELDGTDLTALDLDAARTAVLAAPRHAELFEGTVADNVGAVATGPLGPAVAASAVDEVADALPHGLDTELTEHGRSVSGGQRQRIALARALAADPPVLVLPDPTTAVDAATEHRIATGLRTLRRDRSTVLVTTSPALLSGCDRVVLLESGTVAAAGTHRELAATHERYRAVVLA